jgi:hypothetical protein
MLSVLDRSLPCTRALPDLHCVGQADVFAYPHPRQRSLFHWLATLCAFLLMKCSLSTASALGSRPVLLPCRPSVLPLQVGHGNVVDVLVTPVAQPTRL